MYEDDYSYDVETALQVVRERWVVLCYSDDSFHPQVFFSSEKSVAASPSVELIRQMICFPLHQQRRPSHFSTFLMKFLLCALQAHSDEVSKQKSTDSQYRLVELHNIPLPTTGGQVTGT